MRRFLVLSVFAAALWLAPGALAAGWCGTGEVTADLPDVTTGQQIHAIVAVPSDGPDTFPADAPKLADDVASLTVWWAGQDPTRVPRFDTASFAAGTCLDISFFRLSSTGADLTAAGPSGAFEAVVQQLVGAGFANLYKKYLVYYDGPAVEEDVCGTGSTIGAAVVWLAGCLGAPNDAIATHELLHVFGALPIGAPHPCLGDSGHPCDAQYVDVLSPFTDGRPLAEQVLDVNHDDYYGHSGSWLDVQNSLFLHRLDLPQVALTVSEQGTGTVTANLPGLSCSSACSTEWDEGSQVTLSAAPARGSRFVGWTGNCSGSTDCRLTLSAGASAVAIFGPSFVAYRASVTGKGRIACTPTCRRRIGAGNPLALRAVPARGWRFARWSGGCVGTRVTCRPKTAAALTVHATFTKLKVLPAAKSR
jgi:List-Bact-rpt repeat protein